MMAFKVTEHSESNEWVEATEKLWLKADRETLVADGDPDAAFLFTTPGKRISREDAERHGLVKARAKQGDKQRSPKADKADDEPAKPARARKTK